MIDPLLVTQEPRRADDRGSHADRWQADARPIARAAADDAPVTINEPPSGVPLPDFRAVVRAREVLYFLTWRDVKVRYKQTAIGAAWAILQPLLAMLIFTLVFRRLAALDSEGVPYPIFAYCALVPWTFFATAVTQAGG
ncbi:MAG TPA: ABC transporter permease, partial [Ilumatobacteraceae bacterium]